MNARFAKDSRLAPRVAHRRIFVDTSRLHLQKQPTGIPRVLSKYLEHGHPFAAGRGVELISIELRSEGYFRKRPLPELAPGRPASWGSKALLEIARYFIRLAVALTDLAYAILLLSWLKSASDWIGKLTTRVRHELLRERIDPSAGDIVLCPGYWHDTDADVYARLKDRGAEVILVLHDILPVTQPVYYPYPWRGTFEKRLARSLDFAGHYYCVSAGTEAELVAFAKRHGRTVRASVAFNGFEPQLAQTARGGYPSSIAGRPWLMVGTLEPKKGHRDVLAAFEGLWSTGYTRPLVIVGRRGWMSEAIAEAIETSRWFGERLFWFPSATDEEVAALYSGAHALLFASHAEGFGLPLLEAAGYGVPILAREAPVSREILNDHANFFTGTTDLNTAILEFEDDATYQSARERIAELAWFEWRTVVEAVIADVLKSPESRRLGSDLLDRRLMTRVCPDYLIQDQT